MEFKKSVGVALFLLVLSLSLSVQVLAATKIASRSVPVVDPVRGTTSAGLSANCDISACASGTPVISLSADDTNAMGGTWNAYPTSKVCCQGIGLTNEGCTGSYPKEYLLRLNAVTNAHGYGPDMTAYTPAICLRGSDETSLNCEVTTSSCASLSKACVVRMYGTDNAHFEPCDYSTSPSAGYSNVCCMGTGSPPPLSVPTGLTITTNPSPPNIPSGGQVTFTGTADCGTGGCLEYEWYHSGDSVWNPHYISPPPSHTFTESATVYFRARNAQGWSSPADPNPNSVNVVVSPTGIPVAWIENPPLYPSFTRVVPPEASVYFSGQVENCGASCGYHWKIWTTNGYRLDDFSTALTPGWYPLPSTEDLYYVEFDACNEIGCASDSLPPSQVYDYNTIRKVIVFGGTPSPGFTAVESGSSNISLRWTAVNGPSGTPARKYKVRYSLLPITGGFPWTGWNSATEAGEIILNTPPGLPPNGAPLGVPGSLMGHLVTGLSPGTTYFFAVVACDGDAPYACGDYNTMILNAHATTKHYLYEDTSVPAKISINAINWGQTDGLPGHKTATISWTAPDEDGALPSHNLSVEYDIRVIERAGGTPDGFFTSAAWATASPAAVEFKPVPGVPGTTQYATFSWLDGGYKYGFAIKSRDERGMPAGVSGSTGTGWSVMSDAVYGTAPVVSSHLECNADNACVVVNNAPGDNTGNSCYDNSECTAVLDCNALGRDMTVSYLYSDRNWVEDIKVDSIIQGLNEKTFREHYFYDAVGNLDLLDDYEGLYGVDATMHKLTDFGYDNLNRLTSATGVDDGQADPLNKAGRYFDNIAWAYDKLGNIKKNYELTYCYAPLGDPDGEVCGDSIVNVENNRLTKVKAGDPYFGSDLYTTYTYDAYGNLQTESSWQEIPIGDIDYVQGYGLMVAGIDQAHFGEQVKVLYWHKANPIINADEYYAWGNQYMTAVNYPGTKTPYWDGTYAGGITSQAYKFAVKLKPEWGLYYPASSGSLAYAAQFYNDVTYPDSPAIPFIKQYFRAYVQRTTNYCWDYANRMTQWVDTAGNCHVYSYDHAGNRIKKVTRSSGDASGVAYQTVYITQGNNVIYEDVTELAAFNCPGSC